MEFRDIPVVQFCIYVIHAVVSAILRRYIRRCDRNRAVSSILYGIVSHHRYVLRNSYSMFVKCCTHADSHTVIGAYYSLWQIFHILHQFVYHVISAVVPVCSIIDHIVCDVKSMGFHAIQISSKSLL